jgi:uncharacterized membrane protein
MKKGLGIFLVRAKRHSGKSIFPEGFFLVLSVLFGVAFVVVTPPFQVPDEDAHYFRSYQLSEGGFLAQENRERESGRSELGGFLPESIIRTSEKAKGSIPFNPNTKVDIQRNILSLIEVPLNPNLKSFVVFPNTARYPFVPYIPQAIGILFGRIVGLSPLLLLYLGRLINLAAWISLVYTSIRIIPTGKWVLFLAALTPMSLFVGASLSGDAATNGLSFLFIALMMRYGLEDDIRLTFRGKVLIYTLAILISLCRPPYFLIVFLFLMVPVHKMGSRIKYWTFFGFLVVLVSILNTGWQMMTDPALNVMGRGDVSSPDQIRFILADPFNYIHVVLRTFRSTRSFLITSHFGILGWLDTHISSWLPYLYALVLILTAVVDGNEGVIMKPFQRIAICGTILSLSGAIATALYLTWTSVGAEDIQGIQGRYFIAYSPLFYLVFTNRLIGRKVRVLTGTDEESATLGLAVLLCLFAIGSSTLALWKVVVRYYI